MDVSVSDGATLSFNNELVLNGNTLNKTGLGTLEINNQLAAGGGTVIVDEGLLGGSGTVSGDLVASGGDVSPGVSPGTLSVLGDYLQDASSSLLIELGGTQSGEFDLLNVAGNVALSGMLDVSLISPFTLSAGQSFEIIDVGVSSTGTFSGLAEGGFVGNYGGINLLISYAGGDGNDVSLLAALPGDFYIDGDVDGEDFLLWQRNPSVGPLADWEDNYGMGAPLSASSATVPEPSTLLLGAMASIGLMLRWRCWVRGLD